MKKRLILAGIALVLAASALFPAHAVLAAGSNICAAAGGRCTRAEVGPFMMDITSTCGNEGTCSLEDIQIVFNNVANFVLEIVGALVFLMYVVGGIYFLVSGLPGQEKLREKGKTALKTSTIGLLIVFGAYAFMHTLFGVLQGSGVGGDYVSCGPGVDVGESCALNSTCTADYLCLSECQQQSTTITDSTAGTTTWSECVDTTVATWGNGVTQTSCVPDLCPGPVTEQCCTFVYTSN